MEGFLIKKIQELINKSILSKEDKILFISILPTIDDNELENIAMLFSESPSWIQIMVDNYKQKKEAIDDKSEEKWNAIVAQEKAMLQNL